MRCVPNSSPMASVSRRCALEAGIEPIAVGECVVRGIRENSPYIFTHPEFRDIIESRFQGILAQFAT